MHTSHYLTNEQFFWLFWQFRKRSIQFSERWMDGWMDRWMDGWMDCEEQKLQFQPDLSYESICLSLK